MRIADFNDLCEVAQTVVALYLTEESLRTLSEDLRHHHRDVPARVHADHFGVHLLMLQNPATCEHVRFRQAVAPYENVDVVVVRDGESYQYFDVAEVLAVKAGAAAPSAVA